MSNSIKNISKYSEALVWCYDSSSDYERLLTQVSWFSEYLEDKKNEDIFRSLTDHFVDKDLKHQIIEVLSSDLDEFLANFLHILIDKGLVYYLNLFLLEIKKKLHRNLNIQDIYVYSSFDVDSSRRKKLESIWSSRVSAKKCNFHYLIDKSLKLGIKVQINSFVDEFSISSNLLRLKLKFDSIAL